jgi:hypothetical protein
MALLQINSALGDSPTRSIPLVVDVEADQTPFTPTVNWVLLLTAKALLTDPDGAAKFQLQTGLGITHNGSSAVCALAPTATLAAAPANLYFDIRATHQITGETHLVARGRWQLVRPATRLAIPSMPIYTTAPGTGPDLSALTGLPALVKSALAKPIGTLGAVQLVGDVLTPTAITLPDITTVSAPAGAIGLKRGRISVGDGVTVGGVPTIPRNVKGMFKFDTSTFPITGADARIVSLPIYPEDLPFINNSTYPKYTMYGEITLVNDSYSAAIKDWGIGFAFNNDSLLPKSPSKWIYGSLHPAAGTAKNLTWMTMRLRTNARMYSLGNDWTFYDPDPAFSSYGVTYGTGADNVVSYPVRSMPNSSGTQLLSKANGGLLWLMVHAEKMPGEPVGGIITVNYDLTLEFP